MSRPPAPSGFVWKEDSEALTVLLERQLKAIMLSVPERVAARMHAGETDTMRVINEECRRADAEMESLHLAFEEVLRDLPGAQS